MMKLFIVFTTLFAVVASYPTVKTWTLNELSEVIEKCEGAPEMRKYYIDALNLIMYALFTGNNEAAIHAIILSPSGNKKWTMLELQTALRDPALDMALRPFYERSYHYLLNDKPEGSDIFAGSNLPSAELNIVAPHDQKNCQSVYGRIKLASENLISQQCYQNEVEVVIPALDISTWSIVDLSDALENPDTKPALKPYLEKAKKEIKEALDAGILKENVIMVTPVGLIPVESGVKPTLVARIL